MRNLISIIATLSFLLTGCASAKRLPQNRAEYAKTSAMITLENRTSGGSGVIIRSTPLKSYILTNKHVCQLVQVGGTVITDEGAVPVHSFQVYKRHDLCLITVMGDLHQNNKIAERQPVIYSDMTVAGHPALLPTIVSAGHFANHMPINLIVGSEKCTGDETSQQDVFFCAMMGAKPIIKSFDAQPISATIMAGSSGSGVFNDKGEVSGLVFAGNEGLSYGFIVPLVYVQDFMYHINEYPEQFPNANSKEQFFSALFKMQAICQANKQKCRNLSFQGLYHD
jgi:Trypsin-like peptidase domain